MRILIASHCLPWPLGTGGNAAQFSTLKCLSEDHQFTLVCPIHQKSQEADAHSLAEKLPNVKVRAVFCGQPSGKRPVRLVKDALHAAREWIKGPYLPDDDTPYYPFSPPAAGLIDALSEELKNGVDLFQAEFAEMMPLVLFIPATIPKLFIHHQIHFVYAERVLMARGAKPYSEYLARWMRSQEQLYLSHYDGVVTFSEVDRRRLSELPGIQSIYTSPFPIPADVGIAEEISPGFDGRFLFLGSESWGPNRESLEWLIREIWPLIAAELPSARLEIIGEWSENWRKTVKTPSISFKGFVPDLNAVLRGGTMLVPLRVGSGVRTKILASLAQGIPVIATSVGAEGLLVREGEELLIRDETASFAEAAIQVARDPELWKKLALAGRDAMAAHYSADEVRKRRNEIYATLVGEASSSAIVPTFSAAHLS